MSIFQHIQPVTPDQIWAKPDLSIGAPTRPAPRVLTRDEWDWVFGAWSDWIAQSSRAKNAPPDYVALALLAACGAAIGNSRWAVPWAGWSEPPILWVMIVGDPSAGKSPALGAVTDPIQTLEKEFAREYQDQLAGWQDTEEIAKMILAEWKSEAKEALADGVDVPAKPASADAGKRPVQKRIRTGDATIEKLAELIYANWRGMLVTRDELAGWIESMNRYAAGGDRAFWLEAFGGRSYQIDRKNMAEPLSVDHLAVGVLGGIQPAKLADLFAKSPDDGLLARFIVVYPDPVPLERPTHGDDPKRLEQALRRLLDLSPARKEDGTQAPLFVHFTDDAANTLQEFRETCREWEISANGQLKSHIGKMPGLVVRLALILSYLDWVVTGTDGDIGAVSKDAVNRAAFFIGDYSRQHAHRAYGSTDLPPDVKGAKVIGEIIKAEGWQTFQIRDVQKRDRTGLGTAGEIKAACAVLGEYDWIRPEQSQTSGRPKTIYRVNPRLFV